MSTRQRTPRRLQPSRPRRASSCERRSRAVKEIQAAAIEFHADLRTHANVRKARQASDQWLPTGIQMNEGLTAERLDDEDVDVTNALVDRAEPDVFGADSNLKLAFVSRELDGNRKGARLDHPSRFPGSPAPSLQDIHARCPDEPRDVYIGRSLVDLFRRSDLS